MRLYDLEEQVKRIWSSSYQWRYYEGNIEFGLMTTHGIQWFPCYQSPEKVEKYVNSYLKIYKGCLTDFPTSLKSTQYPDG